VYMAVGTEGGGEPAASADDPPDTETFNEDVDFDISYQQNGRITGTANNDQQEQGAADEQEEQPVGHGPTPGSPAAEMQKQQKTPKKTKRALNLT